MPNPRLASRYAKSLLDLAVEQNAVDTTLQDVQLLDALCRQSKDFTNVLRSPIIRGDKKLDIINAVAGANLNPLTKAFINLMVNKSRESDMPEIASAFISQYKEMKNIKSVKLTLAAPVTDAVKKTIIKKITGNVPDSQVEVTEVINPDIIGGFILQLDDKLIDASVRRDLNDVKTQFQKNIYVSTIFAN
jgi:F-type H+-transporting ATPase subunit delta